jgi:hypothetical protein
LISGLVGEMQVSIDEAEKLLDRFLEENGAPVAYFAMQNNNWTGKIVGKKTIELFRRDNSVCEINRVIYDQKIKNKELEDLGLL